MSSKSSLVRYREFKRNKGTIDLTYDNTFDNTRGSTLLAFARAGFLNTKSFRDRLEGGGSTCTIQSAVNTQKPWTAS